MRTEDTRRARRLGRTKTSRLQSAITIGATLIGCVAGFPSLAMGSPWTLPKGRAVWSLGGDYQQATQEYLQRGVRRDYPLSGEYRSNGLYLGARFGFTDDIELEAQLSLRHLNYDSDPLVTPYDDGSTFDVFDFAQTAEGASDFFLAARYRLVKSPLPTAFELRLKAPTGYDKPSGTFGDEPKTRAEFERNRATVARPENIEDDVSLGDGQLDLGFNLLLGYSFRTRTFLRADGGYKLRLGGAGDEVIANFKIGQLLFRRLLLFAEARSVIHVQRGDVIGITVIAENPNAPPEDYRLLPRVRRLQRDAVDVGGGAVIRVTDQAEANIGYTRTVWGSNTAVINGFFVGVGLSTDLIER